MTYTIQDPAMPASRYFILTPPPRVVVHDYIVRSVNGVLCHPAEFIYGFRRQFGYVPVQQQQPVLRLVA